MCTTYKSQVAEHLPLEAPAIRVAGRPESAPSTSVDRDSGPLPNPTRQPRGPRLGTRHRGRPQPRCPAPGRAQARCLLIQGRHCRSIGSASAATPGPGPDRATGVGELPLSPNLKDARPPGRSCCMASSRRGLRLEVHARDDSSGGGRVCLLYTVSESHLASKLES